MELNADFTQRAVVHGQQTEWRSSPIKGVDRRMMERIGDEVARATTIVRYAPQSQFSAHVHTGGEEFLVLEGVFQDEHGDFPAGSYIRNPPQSSHTPGSEDGCVIFVKLWQFEQSDRNEVKTDIASISSIGVTDRQGVTVKPLHKDDREVVRVEYWEPGIEVSYQPEGGIELLVIEGSFVESGEDFLRQSWLRLPVGAPLKALSGSKGATIWVKEGHLDNLDREAFSQAKS